MPICWFIFPASQRQLYLLLFWIPYCIPFLQKSIYKGVVQQSTWHERIHARLHKLRKAFRLVLDDWPAQWAALHLVPFWGRSKTYVWFLVSWSFRPTHLGLTNPSGVLSFSNSRLPSIPPFLDTFPSLNDSHSSGGTHWLVKRRPVGCWNPA